MPYSNCTTGELRLSSNDLEYNANLTKGRLEICSNNVWFAVSFSYWWSQLLSYTRARYLPCDSLGYGKYYVLRIDMIIMSDLYDKYEVQS